MSETRGRVHPYIPNSDPETGTRPGKPEDAP